ncbi:protein ROOT PRIMORDIUM DEFECTIVE 1 [Elaeis guineensis]|uniref:protein ROOT PRIMORDIUM DEFECTIVE 1 n=1 Tax=Elaeis guineensis var. tenera TaxID=51953 RepID=A0A6J0PIJ7_ELAGV|nr:protein ROOT PRIMORDIUM DEFECTIVE 1 [Elaeis guineensis]XP_019706011.1 protein ROOT PRIMORDIUM DEFECTIVE 1 [Elaeis guineensis]
MLGLACDSPRLKSLGMFRVTILQSAPSLSPNEIFWFGPFNSNLQRRWKKPVDSAQTRLENRTRDLRLDKLMKQLKKLKLVLGMHELMSKRRGHYTSVQLLSRWRHIAGVNIGIGAFLRKYPHIFEIYTHPVKRNLCCKITQKMADLIEEEAMVIRECEEAAVQRLKKLLMMSANGTLHIHALWLIRRELGLPDDFRNSVLPKYPDDFKVLCPDTLELISKDGSLAEAEVKKWREKEYREKWLSEAETKYAFPIHFPTGFKIEKGFREKLKNWQMLPYLKPYENKDVIQVGNVQRFEKRAVGILHEFLCLTVEKMVEVERLSHFRRDFRMEVNVRELLLKHPGIFYISTKGNTQTVFLREAYGKDGLIEPNPVYAVRRKMLDLVLLGCRDTKLMSPLKELEERCNKVRCSGTEGGPCDGDWVIPILEGHDEQPTNGMFMEMGELSDEDNQD